MEIYVENMLHCTLDKKVDENKILFSQLTFIVFLMAICACRKAKKPDLDYIKYVYRYSYIIIQCCFDLAGIFLKILS